MNRLQRELQRLYATHAMVEAHAGAFTNLEVRADGTRACEADLTAPDLIDAQGRVRAMVLGLKRPADWAALSRVWRGVQTELALPAPAIAVCGAEGYQLWFSLVTPVPAAQALAFLDALRQFYLSDIDVRRVAQWPMPDETPPRPSHHARPVPAPLAIDGTWSAFVAPDLAAIFAETPWLDLPPNLEGQAKLLAGLTSTPVADLQKALLRRQPAASSALAPLESNLAAGAQAATEDAGGAPAARVRAGGAQALASARPRNDPRQFLLGVMNDDSVALALRIEAAKALLSRAEDLGPV